MGREFSYAASLSTITLLSYLSLASIFFTYSAINNLSKFSAVTLRVGEIMNMEEFVQKESLECQNLPDDICVSIKDCNMSWGSERTNNISPHERSIQDENNTYVKDVAN